MAKLSHQPVAKTPRPLGPSLLQRVSWDDLRVFAVAARELSFRKASVVLRTSSSTVVRRIERLEEILGVRLFDRLPEGVALTTEGRSVFAAAQFDARLPKDSARSGSCRILPSLAAPTQTP